MPEQPFRALYYRPGNTLPWVFESAAGRLWALPNVPLAWPKKLRQKIDRAPHLPMVPPITAATVAYFLGIPGVSKPAPDAMVVMLGEYTSELGELFKEGGKDEQARGV